MSPLLSFLVILNVPTRGEMVSYVYNEDQAGVTTCLVTTDNGPSIATARPDITGLPERKVTQPYILQMASGKTLPALNEVLVKVTLEWYPLWI